MKQMKFVVCSSSQELATFKTESAAQLFIDALNLKFNHMDDYYIIDVIKLDQEIDSQCEEFGITRRQLSKMMF